MATKIVEKLHETFPDMTALRARSIRVDKQQRKVFVTVSFPDVATIDEKVKSEIIAVVKKSVPKGYYGMVSFADDKFTELTFRKYLADLLKKRFPIYSINKEKTMVKIGERCLRRQRSGKESHGNVGVFDGVVGYFCRLHKLRNHLRTCRRRQRSGNYGPIHARKIGQTCCQSGVDAPCPRVSCGKRTEMYRQTD